MGPFGRITSAANFTAVSCMALALSLRLAAKSKCFIAYLLQDL